MDREEIIRMAREAGISESHAQGMQGFLERFAALVAAAEREACAKVCEATVWSKDVKWWMEATKTQVSAEAGHQCATAIRARGET